MIRVPKMIADRLCFACGVLELSFDVFYNFRLQKIGSNLSSSSANDGDEGSTKQENEERDR